MTFRLRVLLSILAAVALVPSAVLARSAWRRHAEQEAASYGASVIDRFVPPSTWEGAPDCGAARCFLTDEPARSAVAKVVAHFESHGYRVQIYRLGEDIDMGVGFDSRIIDATKGRSSIGATVARLPDLREKDHATSLSDLPVVTDVMLIEPDDEV